MQNALQLGQRQFPLQKILEYLTTSPSLFQYLRLSIIEETLVRWQQSPEYQTIYSEAELSELYRQISQLTRSDRVEASQVEAFKRSLTLKKYQQVHWGHRISSYFLVRKRSLDRAIFSAIQVDNLGIAQELYLRVKDRRQSFEKLARLYSQGTEAKLGGVMGPIVVERIHPQILQRLMDLQPGEISPLFQIDNFHVFVRLEQWLPAKFDDEMKGRLMEELFEQWLHVEISNRISSLHVTAATLSHERIEAIDLDTKRPSLSGVVEIDRSSPATIDVEIVSEGAPPAVSHPPQASAKIDAGISFFPPVAASSGASEPDPDVPQPESNLAIHDRTMQSTDIRQSRNYQRAFQNVIGFCLFFALFLGGGLGVIYLLNSLVGTQGIQLERQK